MHTTKKNSVNCLQLTCSMLQLSCHPNSTCLHMYICWHSHCAACTVTVHQSFVESFLEKGLSNTTSSLGVSAFQLQVVEPVFFSVLLPPSKTPLKISEKNFQWEARTTKEGFINILDLIWTNLIFYCGGSHPQLPIPHQISLTLKCLGSNGHGAYVGWIERNLFFGRGKVWESCGTNNNTW